MSTLSCRGVVKSYAHRTILKGINLDFPEGRIVALLGASGAGKSTLGRILCGLETADRGTVAVSNPAPIMFIPQDFVVWPHLSVHANVALGYRGPKAERDAKVSSFLSKLGLSGENDRRAGELSYGQQQRVAVARAFCFRPTIIILDEPFAHFDVPSRTRAAREIAEFCVEQGTTTVWITHDVEEAFTVAERIAVLDNGLIAQFDTPESVYNSPATETVARLTGEMNIFNQTEWEEFRPFFETAAALPLIEEHEAIGIRPKGVEVIFSKSGPGCSFVGHSFVGHGYNCYARLSSGLRVDFFHPDMLPLSGRYRFRIKGKPCVFGRS